MNIIKNKLDYYMNLEEKKRSSLLLILIVNVEGESSHCHDYEDTSVLSEYYTLDEYEKLSTTYKKIGYEVLTFFDETDFMKAFLQHKIHNNNKKLFVINSAQTGTYIGRKSLIPAFCEHYDIMHAGSNPYVVSLCRDKFHSNVILNRYTSNPLDTYLYRVDYGWVGGKCPKPDSLVIAKLNNESASIGLHKRNKFIYSPVQDAYLQQLSKKYAQSIVVQSFICGYEIELPVLIGKDILPLPCIGIMMDNDKMLGDRFLDYDIRYEHLYNFYNFDDLKPYLCPRIKTEAAKAVSLLGIEGFGRIDFRVTDSGDYYISDVATNPHITEDSSYAFAFSQLGYSYFELLRSLIGVSLTRYYKE